MHGNAATHFPINIMTLEFCDDVLYANNYSTLDYQTVNKCNKAAHTAERLIVESIRATYICFP